MVQSLNTLNKKKVYVVPIEPIDQRYTKQWYTNIPRLIKAAADNVEVITVDGAKVADVTTPGAFLDFARTNVYKATQIEYISRLFSDNLIEPWDQFLFTDAWHFGIPAVKYMSELLDIPVTIHGIWHAGAYDPTDILGMKLNPSWPTHFELALFNCIRYNYFATNFHKEMFAENLQVTQYLNSDKMIRSGQPHDPIIQQIRDIRKQHVKQDIVAFPHRLNSDKQPEIARELAKTFTFDITQDKGLSKIEYYEHLAKAKVIFSCALHENLGISVMEGVLAGAIPLVPDRASYSEMYHPDFKYPSEWTESWDKFIEYKEQLINMIHHIIGNYDRYAETLNHQRLALRYKYLRADAMINNIIK